MSVSKNNHSQLNMIRKVLLALACMAIGSFSLAGRPSDPGRVHPRFAAATERTIKLDNGNTVRVDVCDEGIFRVRISPRKEFEESLMERYGCIKTDWKALRTNEISKGNEWTVSTKSYSLTVNKKTGAISLKDTKGKTVVREIKLLGNKDKTILQL